jgi:hypothetical protein
MKGFIFGLSIGGVGGIVLGLIIGIAVFAGFNFVSSGGTSIPYDTNHSYIAERVSVYDMTDGVQMTSKLVLEGPATFHPFALDVFQFTAKKSYTQSLWIFCSQNDIDVTLTIFGAGDDGKSYLLEFGRHAGNTIQIKAFNQTFSWAKGSNDGVASLIVKLP